MHTESNASNDLEEIYRGFSLRYAVQGDFFTDITLRPVADEPRSLFGSAWDLKASVLRRSQETTAALLRRIYVSIDELLDGKR